MHKESITQALLGTALLFNTVFEMPKDMSFIGQIFSVGLISYMIFSCIEKVKEWEILTELSENSPTSIGGEMNRIFC